VISKHCRRFAASAEGAVPCHLAPGGLDHGAHGICSPSARLWRHVAPQAGAMRRAPHKAKPLTAPWAWLRGTAH
jgi:hypothetical protein